MIDLKALSKSDLGKLGELAAFHWFAEAQGITYQDLQLSERPDFVIELDGMRIGVEVTRAQRTLNGGEYPAQQIEAAQLKFAEALRECISPSIPIEVSLCLNDEIAVDMSAALAALESIGAAINLASNSMTNPSVILLVREEGDMSNSKQTKVVCPEVPEFLQHIQLLHLGQTETRIIGSRGGIMLPFTDEDLAGILSDKHERLKGYQPCDEQWLLIVSGVVPALVMSEEPLHVYIPSMATHVGNVELTLPIKSNFDRVYFLKSPTQVKKLTA